MREFYIVTPSSIIKKIITFFVKNKEKKCFKFVDNLIVTSEKFFDVYYCKLIRKENVLFIPNVPEHAFFEKYKKNQVENLQSGLLEV